MTGMIDYESLQATPDLVKARRAAERSLIAPHESPREFGRRVADEIFEKYLQGEKYVKESDDQESSDGETG